MTEFPFNKAPERIWVINDPHTPNPWVSTKKELWENHPLCLGEYVLASLPAPLQEDWVMVPLEPTAEMIRSGWDEWGHLTCDELSVRMFTQLYCAMIAARPTGGSNG